MARHFYSGRKAQQWLANFALFFIVMSCILMYQVTRIPSVEDTQRASRVQAHVSENSNPEQDIKTVEGSDESQNAGGADGVDRGENDEDTEEKQPPSPRPIHELLNSQTLKDLEQLLFKNQKRPPDSVYNLNVTVSDAIPLDRPVKDTRPRECLDVGYDVDSLPTATVIVPFYNEALSMLLRTVHSVLRRSPDRLLTEVIMIDDCSPNENLKSRLTTYVNHLPKVKLIRNKVRQGLIRSRMIGARMARGEVLVFLDAHTEANVQWLEPLLHEIWMDPKKVVQPNVDKIDPRSIEYVKSTGSVPRGAFSWDLRYVWMQMPMHEARRLDGSKTEPYRTPALVGCAIAVSKKYFDDIGSFDDAFNIWGGENIELAFRVWQCGGQVLTLPCSRVAHTFKPFSYKFDGDKEAIVSKNLMRVAEMWMDDYKKYFYASTRIYSFKNIEFNAEEERALVQRKLLREKLKCKPFKWYMENIVPEIDLPPSEAYLYGEIRNGATNACFYILPDGYIGLTYFCFYHRILPENMFHISKSSRFMFKDKCVRVEYPSLKVGNCDKTASYDKWGITGIHARGLLKVHIYSGRHKGTHCVMQVTDKSGIHKGKQMVMLVKCDSNLRFQNWEFTYRLDYSYVPQDIKIIDREMR